LVGKNNTEVSQELGEGFNYYPDNYWFLLYEKELMGKKNCLIGDFWKRWTSKNHKYKNVLSSFLYNA
jgi:hypothetical protein